MYPQIDAVFGEMRKTLFLSHGIEFIEGLLKLGVVEQGIFARSPKRLRPLLHDNIIINEDLTKSRGGELQDFLSKYQSLLIERSNKLNNVWTLLPGTWGEQFNLLGIRPLNWNYYEYLFWSGKLHQESLLSKYGDDELKAHLQFKHQTLNRRLLLSSQIDESDDSLIYFKPESISGHGVYITGDEVNFSNEFLIRVEKKVWPHIPICQIAVTDGNVTVTYQPSVMVIKTQDGHLNYHGSDFKVSEFLTPQVIKEVDRLTRAAGRALCRAGFKGIYNCDFVYCPDSNRVFFSEVNPRNSGCTFIVDNAIAEQYIRGKTEAILLMPTFLNFQTFLFNGIDSKYDRMITFDEIFADGSATAFSHVFETEYTGKELGPFESFGAADGIAIGTDDVVMTVVENYQLITSAAVPTRLCDPLETFFRQDA